MDKKFTKRDIDKIAKALGAEPKFKGNNYRFVVENEETRQHISLEIYPELKIGDKVGSLISVYTPSAHLQMHFCSGFVVSEMLGEVTFVAECGNRLSGLIVEKEGGCSLYANVDNSLLSGDFTKLGPEVMLSGIALSLAESVLPELSK
jgi:hypothetical protein